MNIIHAKFFHVYTCIHLEVIQQTPAPGKPPPKIHHFRIIIFETLAAPGKPPNNPIPSMWVDPMDAVKKSFCKHIFGKANCFPTWEKIQGTWEMQAECDSSVFLIYTQILYRCYSAFKHTLKKMEQNLIQKSKWVHHYPENL